MCSEKACQVLSTDKIALAACAHHGDLEVTEDEVACAMAQVEHNRQMFLCETEKDAHEIRERCSSFDETWTGYSESGLSTKEEMRDINSV